MNDRIENVQNNPAHAMAARFTSVDGGPGKKRLPAFPVCMLTDFASSRYSGSHNALVVVIQRQVLGVEVVSEWLFSHRPIVRQTVHYCATTTGADDLLATMSITGRKSYVFGCKNEVLTQLWPAMKTLNRTVFHHRYDIKL